ncbi:uncharacterized protein LOC130814829 [Amaranthus tricolor]|uniref:uncharacterized protein LOC130814829 n=1 Tax=Amaranthus tricolor TaxID=29722 RepID=UPI0025854F39|nr:uncharacterized protein LOC130814829 [Amaranthus tricolor]
MEMEGLELQDELLLEDDDFCTSILNQFSNSNDEQHLHLCSIIGAMSQELKDQNVTLSPIAYFGSIVASLDRLSVSSSSSSNPNYTVNALLTLLSMIMPRISVGILRKKKLLLLELLVRVLQRAESFLSDGVVSGLNCVSGLLVIRDSLNWLEIKQFYGFLLGFVTNSDSKVRRQSHTCIRDILQSFQGTPLLVPASEGFTNMFEKSLLLAGESKGATAEKGAQEILHVLEALKDFLPYISMKYKTVILKYYKTLLGVRKPLVTRRITDSLNILCLDPSVEVKSEELVDLLSSLAVLVPMEETSADGMTFTARLLDVGMRKVYNLNRQIAIDKLLLVLKALQDIFGSGFEEAKFAATEAMKNLIQACVDEDLIKQGIDQVQNNSHLNNRKSAPSTIEKICATIGTLLDNRYCSEWDMAFQVVSLMFDKLGEHSSVLLRSTLEGLANIEKESGEDFSERKQLHDCIGSALGAMGPEIFLRILPLKLEADNLSEINDWLFPILKQYVVGASLRFYVESFLGIIGNLKQKSHKLKLEGQVQSSRYADRMVYQVWSLLPSFCNYPSDTAKSFKLLQKVLCNVLSEEPDLHGIVCSSLQILIQQNKCIVEGKNYLPSDKLNLSTERAISRYSEEVASTNLNVLKSSASDFLSVLSKVFLKSTNDPGGSLQTSIGEFASIAGQDVVSSLFKNKMRRLLKVTMSANQAENSSNSMQIDTSVNSNSLSRERAQLFDLAVSLLPGLGPQETDVLFTAIIPALKDVDGLIQKKAYKVLSIILKNSDGFISRKLEELLKLMIEVLPSCHFSAKRHRLHCLYFLIVHVAEDGAEHKRGEIISSFLTEIVLALKEVNKKTRNKAYDILVQIGHACGDEESGGKKENLLQFFNLIAGGLAGETPHMISAAVKGLARLAYEFSDLLSSAYSVLPSSFLLLQRKNREIVKANLGLLKVLVAKSQAEILQNHLKLLVEGLLKWQDDTKNHFKAKVKNLLEMLVKKCGIDSVKAVMPEEHMKLLTNIRKIKERRERKIAANSETRSYHSKATMSRQSEWGHTKIFSDFDEETSDGDDMDAETSFGRRSKLSSKLNSKAPSLRSKKTRSARTLLEDSLDQLENEPLDLLDQQKTRLALRSGGNLKRKHDSDDEPEFDEDGRLVVHEGGRPKKDKSYDHESDEDKSEIRSYASTNSKKAQKRRKTSDSGWAYTGKEYASKKARGDVKKKGKLEPYAYWPLDRKMLSRRPEHRAAARKGMSSVVKLTKKLEGRSVASALSVRSKMKKAHKKK